MLPLSLTRAFQFLSTGTSIRASPFPSRLANFMRPNRVRSPTDWRFSFSCFPPRFRRRSYFRIQTGEHLSEEDFHLSVWVRSQAH